MERALLFVVIGSLVLGCGEDGGAGGPLDAGSSDAGSGSSDAGSGSADSGASDSGTASDSDSGSASGSDAGPPDGGPVSMPCTATGACDPFDPTSCGDRACRPGASGAECADVSATPRALGETCERADECEAGTLCLDFGDGFHCERMCPAGSIGFCGGGSACIGTIGDACIRICRPLPEPCDIYAQDCADPAESCTFATNPETGAPYTGCRTPGTRTRGETCGGTEGSCAADLVCIRSSGITACREPCDPDAADTCPGGEACTGFARTWMVGYCEPAP